MKKIVCVLSFAIVFKTSSVFAVTANVPSSSYPDLDTAFDDSSVTKIVLDPATTHDFDGGSVNRNLTIQGDGGEATIALHGGIGTYDNISLTMEKVIIEGDSGISLLTVGDNCTLTIKKSELYDNSTSSMGQAIFAGTNCSLTLSYVTIDAQYTGIELITSSLDMNRCEINVAASSCGGYYCAAVYSYAGTVNIRNSTLNGSVSGYWNYGSTAEINASMLSAAGNALYQASGATTIKRSTFYGAEEGIDMNGGTLDAQNSTITENDTGIDISDGEITLDYVTIAYNDVGIDGTGGAIYPHAIGIGENTTMDCADSTLLSSQDYNTDEDGTCDWTMSHDETAPNGIGIKVMADNGGATETCALESWSPLINKADTASYPKYDQRGHCRRDGKPERGAYEMGTFSGFGKYSIEVCF